MPEAPGPKTAVPKPTGRKPTGRRKITPAINMTIRRAQSWGPQTAVSKERAVRAFNSAASLLRLNAQAIELMNKLLSFSKRGDWGGDTRPLVWPRNDRLIGQCSFEMSALRRNFRRLAELGLISFRDSAMGRRTGDRDENGKIIETVTFGIDLSPLGLRTPELEAMAEAENARMLETRELSRLFTRHRKMITSIIETAVEFEIAGPWSAIAAELEILVSHRRGKGELETLRSLCASLTALLEQAQTAYAAASDGFASCHRPHEETKEDVRRVVKMDPTGPTFTTSIQNTTEITNLPLYKERQRSAPAEQLNLQVSGSAAQNGFGKKPAENPETDETPEKTAKPVDPATLLVLCPQFKELVWAPTGVGWQNIVEAVELIVKPALNIPDSTWRTAARILGRERAAIAVALIYEKHCAGLINSPGAYLNGLISKAQMGKLALSSSLFHWRDNQASQPASKQASKQTRKPGGEAKKRYEDRI
jgi:replication initiation protein RepC